MSLSVKKNRDAWAKKLWKSFKTKNKIRKGKVLDKEKTMELIDSIKLPEGTKPQTFVQVQSAIARAIEESLKTRMTTDARQILKTWGNQSARTSGKEKLVEPKQAPYLEPMEMKKLGLYLWNPPPSTNLTTKQFVALACYMAYISGARVGEICDLEIEDMEWKDDEEVPFIRLPLRTSKTNVAKTERESITIPILADAMFPVKKWMEKSIGKRKTGKITGGITTRRINDTLAKAARDLGWKKKPSGHSFRISFVINAVKSGCSEQDIVTVCRWKTPTMINVYKANQLENTTHGAIYKISRSTESFQKDEQQETMDTQENTENEEEAQITKVSRGIQVQLFRERSFQTRIPFTRIKRNMETQTEETEQTMVERERHELTPTVNITVMSPIYTKRKRE
jgi:integrase